MLARLALAASLALAATGVGAAEITVRSGSLGGFSLSGPIVSGDAARFRALATGTIGKPVRLFLDSPGGDVVEGLLLADVIRETRADVYVLKTAMCASSCFLALAAGRGKFVRSGARIGIHGAAQNGVETDYAARATVIMSRALIQFGIPPAIIGRLVATPPDRIVWLTRDDLLTLSGMWGYKPDEVVRAEIAADP